MVNKFDIKKWSFKVGKHVVLVVLAGLASIYGDSSWYLMLLPAFTAVENYWKHK